MRDLRTLFNAAMEKYNDEERDGWYITNLKPVRFATKMESTESQPYWK
ncbi:hypothetical protein HDF19_05925 [Mucilaginibacter sp. E4BP6]|nr:hypothetical protein [Mucilaginibacter sp. E4BP6]NYE68015.1 hypothetical protein [Mucilaginibacter sp. E4BP6]